MRTSSENTSLGVSSAWDEAALGPTADFSGSALSGIAEVRARSLVSDCLSFAQRLPQGEAVHEGQRLAHAVLALAQSQERSTFEGSTCFALDLLARVAEGGIPIVASDLKDTLAIFSSRECVLFPGVERALRAVLATGPYFIITGDSAEHTTRRFLVPSKMVSHNGYDIIPDEQLFESLQWITRTGIDLTHYDPALQRFTRETFVAGIQHAHVDQVKSIVQESARYFDFTGRFSQRYFTEEGREAGSFEIRGLELAGDAVSLSLFPAGVLRKEERQRFREEMSGSAFYEEICGYLRLQLAQAGLDYIKVALGGISTIDITTTDKGKALGAVQQNFLGPRDFLVYVGDCVTAAGNDGTAVGVAAATIQVGPERDSQLIIPPGSIHYHSELAAEAGGTGAVLSFLANLRQVALQGLLRV